MTTATKEMPAVLSAGITEESVEALSAFCADTAWMRERRMAAWERYQQIPMPSRRDERWRFTNLRGIDVAAVSTFTACSDVDAVQSRLQATASNEGLAGRLIHVNGTTVSENVLEQLDLPAGAIFCSLDTALRDHAELVQQHFGSAVTASDSVDDKFVALQEATFSNGVFFYVPRNTTVDMPVRCDIVHSEHGATINWRALIVLEEGASATLVEEYTSTSDDLTGFSNAVVELVAGRGANLHYTTVQEYALPVSHFATHRVLASQDSQVEWTAVGLGASRGKSRMEARLQGPGSSVRLNGAYFLDGKQELDYDTQQVHEAPNAFSDLAFKGVLADTAHSVWRGIIDVRPGAQGTDSYQENRNLLLNTGAHADSIPGLQIEANEVRCTHGATISKVDAEQLFYLQARGITREEAVKTVVRGFFTPLLDRIHPEPVRDSIREALWQRMDRHQLDS